MLGAFSARSNIGRHLSCFRVAGRNIILWALASSPVAAALAHEQGFVALSAYHLPSFAVILLHPSDQLSRFGGLQA